MEVLFCGGGGIGVNSSIGYRKPLVWSVCFPAVLVVDFSVYSGMYIKQAPGRNRFFVKGFTRDRT
jgi:hypothetical protein